MSWMRNYAVGIIAGVAATTMGAPIVQASRPPHPWCMVVQDYSGVIACAFDSFEQCRVEARSGNEGFCMSNPFYPSPPERPARARHRTPR